MWNKALNIYQISKIIPCLPCLLSPQCLCVLICVCVFVRLSRMMNNKIKRQIPLRQAAIITCLQRASTERLQSIGQWMPIIRLNEVLHSDSVSRLVALFETLCEVVIFFSSLPLMPCKRCSPETSKLKWGCLFNLYGENKKNGKGMSVQILE